MVNIEDELKNEFKRELSRLCREKGLKVTEEMRVCIYHIKCRRGLLWYTFADIDHSLFNQMNVSILENAPEDKIQVLKEIIEGMENNFNICLPISQTTLEKMYASFFGNLGFAMPLLIMLFLALALFIAAV